MKGLERGVILPLLTGMGTGNIRAEESGRGAGDMEGVRALGELGDCLRVESGKLRGRGVAGRGKNTLVAALDEVIRAIDGFREASDRYESERVKEKHKVLEGLEGKKKALTRMCEDVVRAVGGREWIRNGDGISVKVPCMVIGVRVEAKEGDEEVRAFGQI